MRRRLLAGSAAALVGAALVAVFCYNLWSWCCGRCTVATFFTFGPFGRLLLLLNLGAVAVLLVLKFRRARRPDGRCRCGAILSPAWSFCPDCGASFSISDS